MQRAASRTRFSGRDRFLAISGGLVFAAFIARSMAVRLGGPIGLAAQWLPIAVTASVMAWGALSLRRNVPGVWGRPLPSLAQGRASPARSVAVSGMLAGLAIALSLAGSRMPGVGWAVYWFGALPIMLAVGLNRRWAYLLMAAAVIGLSWTMTAMMFYPRVVRAVRHGLAA